jgi:putative hydrolase
MGIPYYGISSGKLRRYFDPKNFSDPFKVIKGYMEACSLMKKIKPNVVFSKGGFVSVPVVLAAKKRGLSGICLTEHGPYMPGGAPAYTPHSQKMLPLIIDGIRVYKGIEANIINFKGETDIPPQYLNSCEFVIASIHDIVLSSGSEEQNTEAYIKALQNKYVDIIGHADNPAIPCNFERIIEEANKQQKLLELNNNSLTTIRPNSLPSLIKYINYCKKYQVRVCVASDAHFHTMIGNVTSIMKLLDRLSFPPKLIVNLTKESFEAYLRERQHRLL